MQSPPRADPPYVPIRHLLPQRAPRHRETRLRAGHAGGTDHRHPPDGLDRPVKEPRACRARHARIRRTSRSATFSLNARHVIVKRVYGPVTQAELTTGTRLM